MLRSLGNERGLFSLVQKRLKGDLLAAYSCWKGIYKGDGVKLFGQWQMTEQEATATRCSLGGSGWTWEEKKIKSFPRRVVLCWGRSPERWGFSIITALQVSEDLVLEVVSCEREVGVEISRRSFPPAGQ